MFDSVLRYRAQPAISLAWIANHMPVKQDTVWEYYVEGFRRASLAWIWHQSLIMPSGAMVNGLHGH